MDGKLSEKGDAGKYGAYVGVNSDTDSTIRSEVFSLSSVDPALDSKMHLVNNVSSSFRKAFSRGENWSKLRYVHTD